MSNLIKPRSHKTRLTYLQQNKRGDLFLTFTASELKLLGVHEGDMVDFKLVDGQIHITKVPKSEEPKADPKMTSRIEKVKNIKTKKKAKKNGK
jgi:hypothetical protein